MSQGEMTMRADTGAWLNEMALGYTTAEQRRNHRDGKAGTAPDVTEITFFKRMS